jgi:hypothetical protein
VVVSGFVMYDLERSILNKVKSDMHHFDAGWGSPILKNENSRRIEWGFVSLSHD